MTRRKYKSISMIIILLLCCGSTFIYFQQTARASPTTYYVDCDVGVDTNNGSLHYPLKSLRKAINKSATSDIIYMRGGDYTNFNAQGSIVINRSGTRTNPFTIQNYNNEIVTIDGKLRTISSGYGLFMLYDGSAAYNNITISGISFKNSSYHGIVASPSGTTANKDIKITNCRFYNITYYAIQIYNEETPVMHWHENITISRCTFDRIEMGYTVSEGIVFCGSRNFRVNNNTFLWCRATWVSLNYAAYNGVIENNSFRHNYSSGNANSNSIKINPDVFGSQTVSHITIRNNVFWGTDGAGANTCCIHLGNEVEGGNMNNISIYNNLINVSISGDVLNDYCHGIVIENEADGPAITDNVTVMYNTIYCKNGKYSYPIYVKEDTANGAVLKSCVIANNILLNGQVRTRWLMRFEDFAFATTKVLRYNNLYNRTDLGKTWYGWFTDGANQSELSAIKAGPKCVSVSTGNFHLNKTSPAINAAKSTYTVATDYGYSLRPQGSGYDIGAYEFFTLSFPVITFYYNESLYCWNHD